MADTKISVLTAGTPGAADTFPFQRGGTATFAASGSSLGAGTILLPYVAPGTSGNVLTSNGTAWTSAAAAGGGASTPPGRLTLESGVPVSTTDQSDKVTLYYTPYVGNQIMLYSGTAWETKTFAELSLDISAFTASKPYDIWVYNNSGTVTLDSTVWTNATTRATALAYQDGRLVKSGDATRLYLGTIYMDAASKCQLTFGMTPAANGSAPKCYIDNAYNKISQAFKSADSTDSWAYTTGAYRAKNNSDGNAFKFVVGNTKTARVNSVGAATNTSENISCYVGLGIDVSNANSAILNPTNQPTAGYPQVTNCNLGYNFAPGYHYIQEIEFGAANQTFLGDNGSASTSQTGAIYMIEY
jgi:hypothetical protein